MIMNCCCCHCSSLEWCPKLCCPELNTYKASPYTGVKYFLIQAPAEKKSSRNGTTPVGQEDRAVEALHKECWVTQSECHQFSHRLTCRSDIAWHVHTFRRLVINKIKGVTPTMSRLLDQVCHLHSFGNYIIGYHRNSIDCTQLHKIWAQCFTVTMALLSRW
jgi:hypothetical protein